MSLTWTLDDAQGQRLDELPDPVEFFFGGDDLLPRVEQAIDAQEPGFEAHVQLEPEQAFGEYNSALVCFERREIFPDNVIVGMQFEGLPQGAATPDMPGDRIYAVTEVYPEHVVLDGNHPLAGIALRLNLRVHDVREATASEIDAGSVNDDEAVKVLNVAPGSQGLH